MAVENRDFGFSEEFGGVAMVDTKTGDTKQLAGDATALAGQKPPEAVGRPAAAQKYQRKIDLGDGSGVQVFEADTPEALVDKLVQAQEHATRKIRELSRQQRPVMVKPEKIQPWQPPKPKRLSGTELASLASELQVSPAEAFDKLFEARTGTSPEQFADLLTQVHTVTEEQREAMAASQFIADHDEDYLPTPDNYSEIKRLLDGEGLKLTRRNLEYAFQTLKIEGALEMPQSEPGTPSPANEPPPAPKAIDKPPAALSDRSSARTDATTKAGVDVAELQKLPPDQMRDRIVSILRGAGHEGLRQR